MTYEGRKATHLNCLKLNKVSPYADEFKDLEYNDTPKEEITQPRASKGQKRGKK